MTLPPEVPTGPTELVVTVESPTINGQRLSHTNQTEGVGDGSQFASALEFLESLPVVSALKTWEEYERHLLEEKRRLGTLTIPSAGMVYLDTNSVIYSVEKHPFMQPYFCPFGKRRGPKRSRLSVANWS